MRPDESPIYSEMGFMLSVAYIYFDIYVKWKLKSTIYTHYKQPQLIFLK